MKNIFDPAVASEVIGRIRSLGPEAQPLWGKMTVAQMFAHCCVPYEMAFEEIHPKPGRVTRFFLRTFVKAKVVNEKPYPRNTPTAPAFKVTPDKDFIQERDRLIGYVEQTRDLGQDHFEGLESPSFGPLSKEEWNNLFYKHLDHHLTQFGA